MWRCCYANFSGAPPPTQSRSPVTGGTSRALSPAMTSNRNSFRIWILWTDRAELTGTVVRVGLTLDTDAAREEAIRIAVAMGTVSGLGANSRYVGVHAQGIS